MMTELCIGAEHGAFAGHFPGLPVLPGAVLLDEALREIALARDLDLLDWQVVAVKFLEIVRPGDRLMLEHSQQGPASVRFAIRVRDATVAAGTLARLDRHRAVSAGDAPAAPAGTALGD